MRAVCIKSFQKHEGPLFQALQIYEFEDQLDKDGDYVVMLPRKEIKAFGYIFLGENTQYVTDDPNIPPFIDHFRRID